jgi:fructose-1,6-bisphosphatase/inositol monophosphatase family enzyme
MDVVRHLLSRFVCRDLGSATLHLALVATGALDAMFADSTRLWDLAAGYVLVSAAGGTVCQVDGRPWFPIDVAAYREQEMPTVAASPGRADEILRLIRGQ